MRKLHIVAAIALMSIATMTRGQDYPHPDQAPEAPPPEHEWGRHGSPDDGMMRPPPQQEDAANYPRHTGARGHHRGRGPDRTAVDQWLRRIHEENPEEFENLQELRRENPRAFRETLKTRLQQVMVSEALSAYPDMMQAYATMSPEEQQTFANKMYQPAMRHMRPEQGRKGFSGKEGRPRRRKDGERDNALSDRTEQATLELAKAYKTAPSDEDRAAIKAQLSFELERAFDLRNEKQREQVALLDSRITRLERKLANREARRAQIIERRFQVLTEGDPLAW